MMKNVNKMRKMKNSCMISDKSECIVVEYEIISCEKGESESYVVGNYVKDNWKRELVVVNIEYNCYSESQIRKNKLKKENIYVKR
jgi:hypothetical protein